MAEKKTETKKVEPKKKKDTAKVLIPKQRGDKAEFFKVTLNGKAYNIPFNEEVEVPIGVKEIVDTHFKAIETADIYEEEHTI